jgi:hypothetical protein
VVAAWGDAVEEVVQFTSLAVFLVPYPAMHSRWSRLSLSAARVRMLALRYPLETDALVQRIIVGHESANELTLVDSEGMGPNRITIGRNTTSPSLQLGNERVVLDAHLSGQLPLR